MLTHKTEESSAPYETKDKNFFQRAFAPIHSGAMRGSIFALLASAMGTGIFNLPYRVQQTGVVFYVLYLILAGLFSYLGMYTLSRLIHRFKVASYSEMCEQAYGNWFRKSAEFCLILYPWGLTICYQVIFAKFALQLMADIFDMDLYEIREKEVYTTQGTSTSI
jgi:amino acid permease